MTTPQTRSERIEARTTPDTLAIVKRAAEMQGRSLSEFIVTAAEQAAHKAIEEMQIIRLSADDQVRFAKSLLDEAPARPSPAMERAKDYHTQLLKKS